MGLEANSIVGCLSEAAFPTVEELISQLRSSFFSREFQYVTKTLMDREQHIEEMYLKSKSKLEEEKSLLVSENLKLCDELKSKQNEIDALRKLNAEYERKFRVYENRYKDFNVNALISDKITKDSTDSGSNRPPLLSEKEASKKKTEPKLHGIIQIDDDDDDHDDDHKCISSLKGKRVSNVIKGEYNTDDDDLVFIPTSKRRRVLNELKTEHQGKSANISPFLGKSEVDSSSSDSGSDTEKVYKAYMFSVTKMKETKRKVGV